MSKITTVYDAIITRLAAVYPSHKRLSDPYGFEKNTDSEKRQGYGLRVGPASNPGGTISCDMILEQEFTIVLTRMSTAHDAEPSKKGTIEKLLLEDAFLIIKDFEANPGLNSDAVITEDFSGHGGIENVSDRDNSLKIELNFSIKYRENLN